MPIEGTRKTAAREAIVSAIEGMDRAFTAEALVRSLSDLGSHVGTATVYRALSALSDTGYIERIGTRDGAALFCRCDAGGHHHHHIVCDGCGRVETTGCTLGAEVVAPDSVPGFVITSHELVLRGFCPECIANGAR